MRNCRQHNHYCSTAFDGGAQIGSDKQWFGKAGTEHTFVLDTAETLERLKRGRRTIPEVNLVAGLCEFDHRRSTARTGTEYCDAHIS